MAYLLAGRSRSCHYNIGTGAHTGIEDSIQVSIQVSIAGITCNNVDSSYPPNPTKLRMSDFYKHFVEVIRNEALLCFKFQFR